MQDLESELKKVIHDLYGLDFDPDLTPSPDNIDADYSTNTPLKLAKELHKSPMEIANELSKATDNTFITPPGFLNFTVSDQILAEHINNLAKDFNKNISSKTYEGKTVICEFSDPNPFKVLHVGHLYTSIVGDSIARLFEYAGAKVIRANFGGDVGLHVAKTMYALREENPAELTIDDIAKCYVEGTAAYEDDATAHEEITKLNKEIYEINAAGEPKKVLSRSMFGDGPNAERPSPATAGARERSEKELFSVPRLAELYWKGRELSYDYFNQFYDSIGVHFDKYYPESTVANLGLAKVREQLDKGVYEYSDGAVIFNGDKYGLHTRVFINKEGVPTYETKDVGLIFTKWQDYHFDKSVVITGSEQLEYMKVVLKSVEQYAPELVEKTTHLTHGLVKLPGNIKMSSRKGNFLKAVDVLNLVRDALKQEYDSDDETVSLSATKYAFLKYKMGGDIIFDPHESVKMTGNSGPYLLYSAVRAKKILSKGLLGDDKVSSFESISRFGEPKMYIPAGTEKVAPKGQAFPDAQRMTFSGSESTNKRRYLSSEHEHNLMKKLLEYKPVLEESVSEIAPHKLANFLYELAQAFSRFYEHCPVVGCDHEAERKKLVQVYLSTLSHGLNILGIDIPDSM